MRRLIPLAMLLCAASTSNADLPQEGYFLPLKGSYGIFRDPYASDDAETHRLVAGTSGRQVGFRSTTIVDQVKRYAVHDKWILGETESGFFLFDADVAEEASPETFTTIEGWQQALRRTGIPTDLMMLDPDQESTNVSDMTLRPWNYRVMGGALGLTDDLWSLIVQILGFVISIVLGLLVPLETRLLPLAIIMGLVVNIVAMFVIAGGGPGGFVGLVAFPLYCWLPMGIGRLMRRTIGYGMRHLSHRELPQSS